MIDLNKIEQINSVIEEYFTKNTTTTIVPAKELMPDFLNANIFTKDIKKGLPIRKVLRELDQEKKLELIPYIYAEKKDENTYWYFIPKNSSKPETSYKHESKKIESSDEILNRSESDSDYVIDLCNITLKKKAYRQKTFGFLLGDVHKNGKTQTRLSIDAFYEGLKLAIEYNKYYKAKPIPDDDKPERDTVSGMPRGEQLERYALRRAEVLSENNIKLINIHYSDFTCDDRNRIIRDNKTNLQIINNILKKYTEQ